MYCLKCGLRMTVNDTYNDGLNTYRRHKCKCGNVFYTCEVFCDSKIGAAKMNEKVYKLKQKKRAKKS